MPAPDIFNNTARVTVADRKDRKILVECTYGITPNKCIVVEYHYSYDQTLELTDILDTNYESLHDVLPRTAVAVLELHIEKVFNAYAKADDYLRHSDMHRGIYLSPHPVPVANSEGGLA